MKIKTIGIVTAMEQEALAVCPSGEKGRLGEFETLSGSLTDGLTYKCIVSGIGCTRAAKAAKQLCEAQPDIILSVGVSGGLALGLAAGTLIAATTIQSDINDYAPWHASEKETQLRSDIFPDYQQIQCGKLITAESPVLTPQDKMLMHDRSGALAVDMESIAVARAATDAGIPFVCVRAISDSAQKSIPQESLAGVDASGKTRLSPILKAIIKRPSLIFELIPMGMDYSKALKALGKILT